MNTVKIQYADHLQPLHVWEMNEFQGELKELSKKDYEKLKKEILTTGFNFAPHVWLNPDDEKYYLLDGHQRRRVLLRLSEEGMEIPAIPTIVVEARDFKEAKRKVLQGTSQYGQIKKDGLYEFMTVADLKFPEIEESFRFPEIDFEDFQDEFTDTSPKEKKPMMVKCPECSQEFDAKENLAK